MRSVPPRILEMVVGYLTPRAAREHVLGDLQERYVTPLQYLADAVSAIPMLWLSRIRRIVIEPSLLLEAWLGFLMYLSVAWPADAGMLYDSAYVPRFALYAGVQAVLVAWARPLAGRTARAGLVPMFGTMLVLLLFDENRRAIPSVPVWWMILGGNFTSRIDRIPAGWRRQLELSVSIATPVVLVWWHSPSVSPALIMFAVLWAAKSIDEDRTARGRLGPVS